jgi:hypothetical protein
MYVWSFGGLDEFIRFDKAFGFWLFGVLDGFSYFDKFLLV